MTSPTKIGIFGSSGRMGQRLVAVAEAHPDLDIVATVDREGYVGDISHCDVVIDFSLPEATETLLASLEGHSAALVTGVTGRTSEQSERIQAQSQYRAVFSAANFSLGIAVLNHLVAQAVQILGSDYAPEVFEIHHGLKEDAPSGTALLLAETAAKAAHFPWPEARQNRDGHTGPRGPQEIGTAALRGGRVAGEHTVFLFGAADRLELTHRATDRDVFVHGALHAARWVHTQPKGQYGMNELLGLFKPLKNLEK